MRANTLTLLLVPVLVTGCSQDRAPEDMSGREGGASAVQSIPLPLPAEGQTGFSQLDPVEVGLVPHGEFIPPSSEPEKVTGNPGLAAGDIDGDGWVDLFVCGIDAPNALYRNLGNWKFEDVTIEAGVGCEGTRLGGATFADVDGDRDLDLLALSLQDATNALFLNDHRGIASLVRQTALKLANGCAGLAATDYESELHRRSFV